LFIRALYASQKNAPTLDAIVGPPNDDVVSLSSQLAGSPKVSVVFKGLAHSAILGKLSSSVVNSSAAEMTAACWSDKPSLHVIGEDGSRRHCGEPEVYRRTFICAWSFDGYAKSDGPTRSPIDFKLIGAGRSAVRDQTAQLAATERIYRVRNRCNQRAQPNGQCDSTPLTKKIELN
jgi:hypothetical protein